MSSRKKVSKPSSSEKTATRQSENKDEERETMEEEVVEREGGEGGGGGLREFVKKMDGKSHRMVEMRLGVVGACAVAFRILLYDDLQDKEEVAWSVLSLIAVCLLVVILSTWLDYFPSKLIGLRLREADGQGLALGCVLVPTLVCSAIHCTLYTTPHHVGVLSLYLLILCSISILTLSYTILHSIPTPNNITFYNFVAVGMTVALYYWLDVPYWLLLPCIMIYSILLPWLLMTFPTSFTICEAMIVGQSLTLLIIDTVLQLIAIHDLYELPEIFSLHRYQSLLYIEFLIFGVILCCLLLSPVLYKISQSRNYIDLKFWSGTFILLSLCVGMMMVLPWLQNQLRGYHPIALVLVSTFTVPVHVVLMIYWLGMIIATLLLVAAQSSEITWLTPLKVNNPSSLWMRKCFHLLAVLIYLPGVALDSDYLALATALIIFLFIILELLRYFHMWPGGKGLHLILQPFLDSRDTGNLLLSHLYLLIGLSLPLWVSPLRQYHHVGKLSLYSGVLALGVGDSMAAVAGSLMGKTKWPGTKKTVEGSMMSILTQLLVVMVIVIIDPHIAMPTIREWGVVSGSVVATAFMEAYTGQIDNLILTIFQLAFFLTFL